MNPLSTPPHTYRVGPYLIDPLDRKVLKFDQLVSLTPAEFDAFYQIVDGKGKVVERRDFTTWKDKFVGPRHPVDMVIKGLRRKLDDPEIIVQERGSGYRLSATLPVEIVSNPTSSEVHRKLTIALNHFKTYTTVGLQAAISSCEELIKQGELPMACYVIALGYLNLGMTAFCRIPWRTSVRKTREFLAITLKHFPEFGSAYALRALTHLFYDYAWDKADSDFIKALQLSPRNELAHSFLAHRLVAAGLFEEALVCARRTAEWDFENPISVSLEPWMYLFAGRVDEAIDKGESAARRFSPSAPVHGILGDIYCADGSFDDALEQYRIALEIEFLPHAIAARGFVFGRRGNHDEAIKCLRELHAARESGQIQYVSGWHEALIYAGLGNKPQALDALERAFEERCDWLIHIEVEPRWKELRSEKRFKDLVERLRITKPNDLILTRLRRPIE
jgi:tetratricopeptide (TPR) repeat protein